MKVFIFASSIVTLGLFTRALIGQVSSVPKEPEFVNSFSYLEKDGVFRPLERQSARPGAKAKGLGFGGARASYVIPNDRSTVRFSADTDLSFIVRPAGPTGPGGAAASDVDPATIVQLYRLKVIKGQRELQIVTGSLFRGSKGTQEESAVQFEITKYGKQSVVIKPLKPLPPGEYMWAANATFMVPQAYCFGVDSAKP